MTDRPLAHFVYNKNAITYVEKGLLTGKMLSDAFGPM